MICRKALPQVTLSQSHSRWLKQLQALPASISVVGSQHWHHLRTNSEGTSSPAYHLAQVLPGVETSRILAASTATTTFHVHPSFSVARPVSEWWPAIRRQVRTCRRRVSTTNRRAMHCIGDGGQHSTSRCCRIQGSSSSQDQRQQQL